MERPEEIESYYKKQIEILDKEFLEKLKGIKDKKEVNKLEQDYKKKNSMIQLQYEKKYIKYLEYIKKNPPIDPEKEKKKKEDKEKALKDNRPKQLIVTRTSLELTKKDQRNIKWSLFKFNLNRKYINSKKKYIPNTIKDKIIFIKFKIRYIINSIKRFIDRKIELNKNRLIKFGEKISQFTKSTYLKSKKVSKQTLKKLIKTIEKFTKKKDEKGDNKEKRPDEEIAEKILKKTEESS